MNRREFFGVSAWTGLQLSSAEAAPQIIDAHCHAGKGEALTAPWSSWADPEVTLRRAKQAGIHKTVIFPIGNSSYREANREIARFVSTWPEHFIGFAKHDPETEKGEIRRLLTEEVRELGLRGLKLHKIPTREVLDAVAELRIPVLFHPPRVADFHTVASAYPEVTFIMAHLGSFGSDQWTEHILAVEIAQRYDNVFLETSSVVFQEYLELAARELPARKLIFGSDGPLVDSRVELYKIRLLELPPDQEALVLGGNMQRILGETP